MIRRSDGEDVRVGVVWMKTSLGEEIPGVYVSSKWDSSRKYTLIYSHSEGEDVGGAVVEMMEVAEETGCDVFCYDYSGYGLASGKPSERKCYADIRASYDYIVKERGVHPGRVVLFGKSLGTGPSVELASKMDVAGLVLVSTLLSLSYSKILRWTGFQRADVFSNVDKIHRVKCQVLIVHGMRDQVVPYNLVVNLFRRVPNKVAPVIVPLAGHDNICTEFRHEVMPFLKQYLNSLTPPSTTEQTSTDASSTDDYPTRDDDGNRPLSKAVATNGSCYAERPTVHLQPQTSIIPEVACHGHQPHGTTTTRVVNNAAAAYRPPHHHHAPRNAGRRKSLQWEKSLQFWHTLGLEVETDHLIDDIGAVKPSPHRHSIHVLPSMTSQRALDKLEQLFEVFEGKLTHAFLLQCLRVYDYDLHAAAEIAKKYRRMMKVVGCHPRRGISIREVKEMLLLGPFLTPNTVDVHGYPTLFISTQRAKSDEEHWVATLTAMIYLIAYLHEDEETHTRGITIVLDLRGESWNSKACDFWRRILRAILTCYPCRINFIYTVDSGRLLHGPFLTRKLASRRDFSPKKTIEVKPEQIGRYFAESQRPPHLGGCARHDMLQFVLSRKRLERTFTSHKESNFLPIPPDPTTTPISALRDSMAAPRRSRTCIGNVPEGIQPTLQRNRTSPGRTQKNSTKDVMMGSEGAKRNQPYRISSRNTYSRHESLIHRRPLLPMPQSISPRTPSNKS